MRCETSSLSESESKSEEMMRLTVRMSESTWRASELNRLETVWRQMRVRSDSSDQISNTWPGPFFFLSRSSLVPSNSDSIWPMPTPTCDG
ncbi:hypothetical protein ACFX2B_039965 [Malus domestica]